MGGIALANKRPLLQGNVRRLVRTVLRSPSRQIRVRAGKDMSLGPCRVLGGHPSFAVSCGTPSDNVRGRVLLSGLRLLNDRSALGFIIDDHESVRGTLRVLRGCELIKGATICFDPIFNEVRPIRVISFLVRGGLGSMGLRVRLRGIV